MKNEKCPAPAIPRTRSAFQPPLRPSGLPSVGATGSVCIKHLRDEYFNRGVISWAFAVARRVFPPSRAPAVCYDATTTAYAHPLLLLQPKSFRKPSSLLLPDASGFSYLPGDFSKPPAFSLRGIIAQVEKFWSTDCSAGSTHLSLSLSPSLK